MCALSSSCSALALFLHHGAQDRDMFDAGRFDAIDALEVKAANDADALGDVSKQARHLIEQIRAFQAGRPSSGLARTLANIVITTDFGSVAISWRCWPDRRRTTG